jgi:hypothetical protein
LENVLVARIENRQQVSHQVILKELHLARKTKTYFLQILGVGLHLNEVFLDIARNSTLENGEWHEVDVCTDFFELFLLSFEVTLHMLLVLFKFELEQDDHFIMEQDVDFDIFFLFLLALIFFFFQQKINVTDSN